MAGGSASFGGGDDERQMIVDINVTPLVDITLVLLIIFMVTAVVHREPAIKVDLPKAASGSDQTKTTLSITISKDGSVYLNGERSSDGASSTTVHGELPEESRPAGHHRRRQGRVARRRHPRHRSREALGGAPLRAQRRPRNQRQIKVGRRDRRRHARTEPALAQRRPSREGLGALPGSQVDGDWWSPPARRTKGWSPPASRSARTSSSPAVF